MRRNWVCIFAMLGLFGCSSLGQAQVFIRAPFVRVQVGPPAWPGGPSSVYVRAPFVRITNGYPAPVLGGPPVVLSPAPVVVNPNPMPVPLPANPVPVPVPLSANPVPAPPPEILNPPVPVPQNLVPPGAATIQPPPLLVPQAVPLRAMTVNEFVKAFRPAPGKYQVTLLHPRTNVPVTVAFTLPEGNPRVRVNNRLIEFDYGRLEVEIRFLLGGRVEVNYFD